MSLFFKETTNTAALPTLHKLVEWSIKLAFLPILILVFVPFSPKMPAPGLDASWALGLNQAVAQGLSFGKEIIFTLGPYSSIYTKFYHPSTDLMMIAGSIYLALSYWLSIILVMNGIKWRWIIAFAILIFGMIYARDSLFFSYPLLVSLDCFKNLSYDENNPNSFKYPSLLLAVLFAPLGLLALIKGSLLIISIVVSILCSAFFTLYKEQKLALTCLLSPLISIIIFWIFAGQSIVSLPYYFINSIYLASGFSEAMATVGDHKEIVLYLISSTFILFTIVWQKQTPTVTKLFYLISFIFFLFLSFKAGFTRHFGHSFIPGTSILIAALLLPFLLNSKLVIPVIIFSIYTTSYIDGQHTKISLLNNFISTYSSSWYGLKNRITDKNWVKQNYYVTMNYLQNQIAFPVLNGKTDIYSYDQSYLFASGMNWSPRPIFQSYTVFTPAMAEHNKNHLLSKHSPDNIIFKVQPIDERIPSLDDGASWPELLNNYHPVQLINDFLILKKNLNHKITISPQLFKSEHHVFGEVVLVPDSNQPLFVEINIKPTLWGLLATSFFKPHQLEATIELKNGTKKTFRIIANMAKSGFLLSPFIEETAEFGLLYSQNIFLDNKKVKSIIIASTEGNTKQWNNKYTIYFKNLIN